MSIASEISRINGNIAAAYTSCSDKGATMPQAHNSANLADTIDSIQQSSGTVSERDVNFYDYDGTLLYGFTFAETAQLSALPALPGHPGLTSVSWTHTLQQIQIAVQSNRRIDVGATYTTDDNSTRLYITIPNGKNLTVPLEFSANSGTIDWGDGTVEQANRTTSHTYAPVSYPAHFIIRITGTGINLGEGNYSVFGNNDVYRRMLTKAEIGSVSLMNYCFSGCSLLESIIIPQDAHINPGYLYYRCFSLKAYIANNIPLYNGVFYQCYSLKKVIKGADSNLTIYPDMFGNCHLESFDIPATVTKVSNGSFRDCLHLKTISIPSSVTVIDKYAFSNCPCLSVIDMTAYEDPTAVPTLNNVNAFSSLPATVMIIVKNQAMLDAFSAATNWSALANLIFIKGT